MTKRRAWLAASTACCVLLVAATVGCWLTFGTSVVSGALTVVTALLTILVTVDGLVRRHAPVERIEDVRLVDDRVPRLADLRDGTFTATELGVGTAIEPREPDSGEMPYVPRDLHAELREALRRGGVHVLTGGSATGKSRLALEVLRDPAGLDRRRPFLVPGSAAGLRRLGESSRRLGRAVVWLDDLDRFLADGDVDSSTIDRLCAGRRRGVVVLATIREDTLARLGTDDRLTRPGADVVEHRLVTRWHVRPTLSPSEQERAKRLRGDSRVAQALADGGNGFTQYVAAGPQMMARWCAGAGDLHPGRAIISAAVDLRRAGYHSPVPERVLELHWWNYLEPAALRDHPDLVDFAEALRWARAPVAGAPGCLAARRGGYLAADYLLDQADNEPSPLAGRRVSPGSWYAALELSGPADALAIGVAAWEQGERSVASLAFDQCARTSRVRDVPMDPPLAFIPMPPPEPLPVRVARRVADVLTAPVRMVDDALAVRRGRKRAKAMLAPTSLELAATHNATAVRDSWDLDLGGSRTSRR